MQATYGNCDWDEYVAPPEEYHLTLTYALIADGGIVLAADSQITREHDVGNGKSRVVAAYQGKKSKLRTLGNGSAFSVAGNPDW
jgi:hypothetical protein